MKKMQLIVVLTCLVLLMGMGVVNEVEAATTGVPLKPKIEGAIIVQQFLVALEGTGGSMQKSGIGIPIITVTNFKDFTQLANGPVFAGLLKNNFFSTTQITPTSALYTGDVVYLTIYHIGSYPVLFIYVDRNALADAFQKAGLKWTPYKLHYYIWDGKTVTY